MKMNRQVLIMVVCMLMLSAVYAASSNANTIVGNVDCADLRINITECYMQKGTDFYVFFDVENPGDLILNKDLKFTIPSESQYWDYLGFYSSRGSIPKDYSITSTGGNSYRILARLPEKNHFEYIRIAFDDCAERIECETSGGDTDCDLRYPDAASFELCYVKLSTCMTNEDCGLSETCNTDTGSCDILECGDNEVALNHACVSEDLICESSEDCDDSLSCTTDACENGLCTNTEVVCASDDPCSEGVCKEGEGCVYKAVEDCTITGAATETPKVSFFGKIILFFKSIFGLS